MAEKTTLKRTLGLPMLVLYGLGTTIGAGIYALIGEVAAVSGYLAPMAFLIASLLAGVTALSFAELSSRFPRSAGEAVYVREGLGLDSLAVVVGLMVVAAGLVSAATVINGFVGYFQDLVAAPRGLIIVVLVLALFAIAAWGIGESVAIAAALTVVEAGGLVAVIWAGRGHFLDLPARLPDFTPGLEAAPWIAILAGGFLAFYAFIGFEDMVNVAEEVEDAPKVLPAAIIITFVVTLIFYLALAVVAVLALPIEELAASKAPLSLVFERATGGSGQAISLIGTLATVNGALIQVIMASRILYGLAAQGLLPAWLARVNARTRTPVAATGVSAAIVLALALPLGIAVLAQATSAITLTVFACVNLALWRLKGRGPGPNGGWTVPRWVPAIGFLVTGGFLIAEAIRLIAG